MVRLRTTMTLMVPKGDWKLLERPKLETIKVEKKVGNPNNTALTFDMRNAGGDLADALFIDGNEDMADYTMKLRFRVIEETDKFAVAGIIVRTAGLKGCICAEAANKRNCCGQDPPIISSMFLKHRDGKS